MGCSQVGAPQAQGDCHPPYGYSQNAHQAPPALGCRARLHPCAQHRDRLATRGGRTAEHCPAEDTHEVVSARRYTQGAGLREQLHLTGQRASKALWLKPIHHSSPYVTSRYLR